jgi:hypothetical protein
MITSATSAQPAPALAATATCPNRLLDTEPPSPSTLANSSSSSKEVGAAAPNKRNMDKLDHVGKTGYTPDNKKGASARNNTSEEDGSGRDGVHGGMFCSASHHPHLGADQQQGGEGGGGGGDGGGGGGDTTELPEGGLWHQNESNLEELMVMEAIRQSLSPRSSSTGADAAGLADGSRDQASEGGGDRATDMMSGGSQEESARQPDHLETIRRGNQPASLAQLSEEDQPELAIRLSMEVAAAPPPPTDEVAATATPATAAR